MKTTKLNMISVCLVFCLFVTVTTLASCNFSSSEFTKTNPISTPSVRTEQLREVAGTVTSYNVKLFGAKGDQISDDTIAIQAAIDEAAKVGGVVNIPPGIYLVDAKKSVRLRSGITLNFMPDAVLRAIPNDEDQYAVLLIDEVSDVNVFGGTILGERWEHSGETGQWGMGIRITGAKRINIVGTKANECWGDGFYIGQGTKGTVCENIKLSNIQANFNRRQGLSLISGRNIQILNAQISNTKGQSPESGIDIEPNKITDVLENITITNAVTSKNQGAGIVVSLSNMGGATLPVSIYIKNHSDDGSGRGFLIFDRDTIVPGQLIIEQPEWKNSIMNGITILNHHFRSYHVYIDKLTIVNANRGASSMPNHGAAIAIHHNVGLKNRTGGIGNVFFNEPHIVSTLHNDTMVTAFWIWDIPEEIPQNLIIKNPTIIGRMLRQPIYDNVKQYIR